MEEFNHHRFNLVNTSPDVDVVVDVAQPVQRLDHRTLLINNMNHYRPGLLEEYPGVDSVVLRVLHSCNLPSLGFTNVYIDGHARHPSNLVSIDTTNVDKLMVQASMGDNLVINPGQRWILPPKTIFYSWVSRGEGGAELWDMSQVEELTIPFSMTSMLYYTGLLIPKYSDLTIIGVETDPGRKSAMYIKSPLHRLCLDGGTSWNISCPGVDIFEVAEAPMRGFGGLGNNRMTKITVDFIPKRVIGPFKMQYSKIKLPAQARYQAVLPLTRSIENWVESSKRKVFAKTTTRPDMNSGIGFILYELRTSYIMTCGVWRLVENGDPIPARLRFHTDRYLHDHGEPPVTVHGEPPVTVHGEPPVTVEESSTSSSVIVIHQPTKEVVANLTLDETNAVPLIRDMMMMPGQESPLNLGVALSPEALRLAIAWCSGRANTGSPLLSEKEVGKSMLEKNTFSPPFHSSHKRQRLDFSLLDNPDLISIIAYIGINDPGGIESLVQAADFLLCDDFILELAHIYEWLQTNDLVISPPQWYELITDVEADDFDGVINLELEDLDRINEIYRSSIVSSRGNPFIFQVSLDVSDHTMTDDAYVLQLILPGMKNIILKNNLDDIIDLTLITLRLDLCLFIRGRFVDNVNAGVVIEISHEQNGYYTIAQGESRSSMLIEHLETLVRVGEEHSGDAIAFLTPEFKN